MLWAILAIFIIAIVLGVILVSNNGKVQEETKIKQNQQLSEKGIVKSVEYMFKNSFNDRMFRYIVDNEHKNVCLCRQGFANIECIPFSKITGFEVLTDSQVTGGIGRAIVGGVLAGEVGAIVGAQTAKKKINNYTVVIYVEDINRPKYEMVLINREAKTNDPDYLDAVKFSNNINASIKTIISQNNKTISAAKELPKEPTVFSKKSSDDSKEKLAKLKEWYAEGLITAEEYNDKKKEILGDL